MNNQTSAVSALRLSIYILGCSFLPVMGMTQALGTWNFSSTAAGTPAAFNTVGAAIFSPAITSTAFNGGSEFYGQGGWPSGAMNSAAYFQFSLTPNPGYQLDLTSLVLRMRRSNTGSPAGSGPTAWRLRSSVDGFNTDIASGTMSHNYSNYSVPLGISFHSLHGMVTFRVYGYNNTTSSGGSSRMVFDQVLVSGINIVLPLNFLSFTGTRSPQLSRLHVKVDNLVPGTLVSMERSEDGSDFRTIGFAASDPGFAPGFNFRDSGISASRDYYYRFCASEPDGRKFYSRVVHLAKTSEEIFNAYFSPGVINVSGVRGKGQLNIFQLNGTLLSRHELHTSTSSRISIPCTDLRPGIYIVQFYSRAGNTAMKLRYQ